MKKEYKIGDTWTAPDGRIYELIPRPKDECISCDIFKNNGRPCPKGEELPCKDTGCILKEIPTEWQDREWGLMQLLHDKMLEGSDGSLISYYKGKNTPFRITKSVITKYSTELNNSLKYRLHQPKQEPENDKAAEMCYKSNPSQVYWSSLVNKQIIEPVKINTDGTFCTRALVGTSFYKLNHNKEKTKFWFTEVNEKGEEI
jgi:hypothetical protein